MCEYRAPDAAVVHAWIGHGLAWTDAGVEKLTIFA